MLEKILPKQVNNEFPGYKFSAYVFLVFTVVTVARSLAHMILPDGGAGSIASIDMTVEGAAIIVGIFGQWGLSQLLMAGLYIVVYFRYQSLIPLMYIIIITEYVGRISVGLLKPIETMGIAPGAAFNFIIIPLAILLFIFAIREPTQDAKSSQG